MAKAVGIDLGTMVEVRDGLLEVKSAVGGPTW
jgi:hypothetical protein